MDKNEIKENELEEISGGFIPPLPLSAEAPKGVMPIIFASKEDDAAEIIKHTDSPE